MDKLFVFDGSFGVDAVLDDDDVDDDAAAAADGVDDDGDDDDDDDDGDGDDDDGDDDDDGGHASVETGARISPKAFESVTLAFEGSRLPSLIAP